MLTCSAENRRFVEVVVKSRKRFEALRDFTVEGALTELDRMTMERKDTGEPTGVNSPTRNVSLESARSLVSARSSSLGNVPEDSAFSIGDDDDVEDRFVDHDQDVSTPTSQSGYAAEDSVPTQSRSMSEKARGKQPIGFGNFARSTSQNTSNTSLPSLNTQQASTQQLFTPTHSWVGGKRSAISSVTKWQKILTFYAADSYLATVPTTTHYTPDHRR